MSHKATGKCNCRRGEVIIVVDQLKAYGSNAYPNDADAKRPDMTGDYSTCFKRLLKAFGKLTGTSFK